MPAVPTSQPTKTKKVYITGFGQFHSIKTNPSFLVASSFPPYIPQKYLQSKPPQTSPSSASHTAINPTAGSSSDNNSESRNKPDSSSSLKIQLITRQTPVKVSYKAVEELQHEIPSDVDLVLHIGVASSYKRLTVEIRARSGIYAQPDVDGKKLKNGRAIERKGSRYERGVGSTDMAANGGNSTSEVVKKDGDKNEEGACVLRCSLDFESAVERFDKFKKKEGFEDVVKPLISDDAGLYLCEYIYYNSLYTRIYGIPDDSDEENDEIILTPTTSNEESPQKVIKKPTRPSTDEVIFIHVPYQTDKDSVTQYVETIMFLVAGMFLAKEDKEDLSLATLSLEELAN